MNIPNTLVDVSSLLEIRSQRVKAVKKNEDMTISRWNDEWGRGDEEKICIYPPTDIDEKKMKIFRKL